MRNTSVANAPAAALRLLRDRTLVRAVRSYLAWIGRAVGWWSIAYLLFWIMVFVVTGLQSLPRLDSPLVWSLPRFASILVTVLVLSPLMMDRVPPVRLDRRDLIRLALAPVMPWRAMRWSFAKQWLARAGTGVLLGLVWTLFVGVSFQVSAPWAIPAVVLLLLAHLHVTWILYADRHRPVAQRSGLGLVLTVALFSLLGWWIPEWGLASALVSAYPVGLLPLITFSGLSLFLVRGSLLESYPSRFAPQCLALAQLQGLRLWDALSRMAGTGSGSDPGERERLLSALHDTPYASRPRRSLPLPNSGRSARRAVAWRGLQSLYRRSILRSLETLTLLVGAFVLAGGSSRGLLGAQLPAVMLTWAAATLLGPSRYPATLPLRPMDRTLSRVAPGMGIALAVALACLVAAIAVGVAPSPLRLLETLTLPPVIFVGLEKLSSWIGGASAPEALIAAAILASTPSLLASALGMPELAMLGQVLLGILVLLLPF